MNTRPNIYYKYVGNGQTFIVKQRKGSKIYRWYYEDVRRWVVWNNPLIKLMIKITREEAAEIVPAIVGGPRHDS